MDIQGYWHRILMVLRRMTIHHKQQTAFVVAVAIFCFFIQGMVLAQPALLPMPPADVRYEPSLDYLAPPEAFGEESFNNNAIQYTPLTLAEVESMALANNPAMQVANSRVSYWEGIVYQKGLGPNPTVGYLANELGNESSPGQHGIYVGRTIIRGGKLGLAQQVAARERDKAIQNQRTVWQRIITDARTKFYAMLVAHHRTTIAQDIVDSAEKTMEFTKKSIEAGEATEIDLVRQQLVRNRAAATVRQYQALEAAAWRELAALLGDSNMPERPLTGDIQIPQLIDWATAQQKLLAESPLIAEAIAEIERARWAVDSARAQATPDVNWQFSIQHDFDTDDAFAGIQVGAALPCCNANQGNILAAQADVNRATQRLEKTRLMLSQQLAKEYGAYQSAARLVDEYDKNIIPPAERALELTIKSLRAQVGSSFEVVAAEQALFQVQLEQISAIANFWTSHQRIEGLLLDGSLEN